MNKFAAEELVELLVKNAEKFTGVAGRRQIEAAEAALTAVALGLERDGMLPQFQKQTFKRSAPVMQFERKKKSGEPEKKKPSSGKKEFAKEKKPADASETAKKKIHKSMEEREDEWSGELLHISTSFLKAFPPGKEPKNGEGKNRCLQIGFSTAESEKGQLLMEKAMAIMYTGSKLENHAQKAAGQIGKHAGKTTITIQKETGSEVRETYKEIGAKIVEKSMKEAAEEIFGNM